MFIEAKEILPNVVVLTFDSQYECSSSMMRMEEFYESPLPKIRGEYFTTEQFMDAYAESKGGQFTYFTDWAGFNIPGGCIAEFSRKFHYDLSQKEAYVLKLILGVVGAKAMGSGDFYVIAHTREDTASLHHEIAHAMYSMDDRYKTSSLYLVSQIPSRTYERMRKILLECGYHDFMVNDEIQAYLSTNTGWLIFNFNISKKLQQKFKDNFGDRLASLNSGDGYFRYSDYIDNRPWYRRIFGV